MRKYALVVFCFGASLLAFSCTSETKTDEEDVTIATAPVEALEPGLAHVVHFWLTEGLSEQATASFISGVESLGSIPSVKKMWIGKPASTPSRGVVDNSFDFSLIVWFDDVAGHDIYQEHETHLKFVAEHEAKFAKVRVRDTQY